MRVTEMRIGNYVNLYGNIATVQKSDYSTGLAITEGKGIPLTEQWVKDFGFVNKGTVFKKGWFELWYSSYAENYQLRIYKTGSTFETIINIKFVHTLQNLFFSLTNTELTKK